MSGQYTLKDRLFYYKERFKELLRTTTIEMYLLAGLGGFFGGLMSWNHEDDKSKVIPLAFSEIEQIEKDAERNNMSVPPITQYLAGTNDMLMKVFECWNDSHRQTLFGNNNRAFASELENRMDPSFRRYKYEIIDFAKKVPAYADSALKSMKPFVEVDKGLPAVINNFDAAWDDEHEDVGHIEVKTRIVTDADGNTSIETYTEWEYDYTIHTYTYHYVHGENASRSIDNLINSNADFQLKEKLMVSSETHAENEYAIEKSREKQLKGKRLDELELIKMANTWATGSTLMTHLPRVYQLWNELHTDANLWRSAKRTAKSDEYETYSSQDDGPQEFQVAENTLEHATELKGHLTQIISAVKHTKSNIPILEAKINEYIATVMDRKEGNPNRLKNEIMLLSREMYQANFNRGFDVEPFKAWHIVGFTLLGLAAGFSLGVFWDYANDNYDWAAPARKRELT